MSFVGKYFKAFNLRFLHVLVKIFSLHCNLYCTTPKQPNGSIVLACSKIAYEKNCNMPQKTAILPPHFTLSSTLYGKITL